MADINLGAARRSARAFIRDNAAAVTTRSHRGVTAYIGENYLRAMFETAGDLNGSTPDEGPGGAVWQNTTTSTGTVIERSGGRARPKTPTLPETAYSSASFIETNQSSGFLSAVISWSNTGADPRLSFRCTTRAVGTSGSGDSMVASNGYSLVLENVGAGTNYNLRLLRNGAALGAGSTATINQVVANGDYIPVEIYFRGAGTTGDPTVIEVWVIGTDGLPFRAINVSLTAAVDQTLATGTMLGISFEGTASAGQEIAELFFTDVPSSLATDFDQGSASIPYGKVAAGAAIPIKMRWHRYLAPDAVNLLAPTHIGLALQDDAGNSIGAGSGWQAISGETGYFALPTTFHATADRLSTGATRAGVYRMVAYLKARNAADTADVWRMNSENITTGSDGRLVPAAGGPYDHLHGRGYDTATVTTALAAEVLDAAGAVIATPTPVAYPEQIRSRLTLGARPYQIAAGYALTHSTIQAGAARDTATAAPDTTGLAVSPASLIDFTYDQTQAGVGLRWTSPDLGAGATAYNGDPYLAFSGSAPAGYEYVDSLAGTRTGAAIQNRVRSTAEDRWTVDPRLTVTQTRTAVKWADGSAYPGGNVAVVNFGLHRVEATFTVANARGTLLTSALPGNLARLLVRSRDVAAGADQGQVALSLLPDAAGTYSVTRTFPGPTSTASRGTGTEGDTAAHDQTGRAKTLRVWANTTTGSPAADAPHAVATGTLVALSDLLRLDSHPQRSLPLRPETDPYADTGEDLNYTIAVHRVRAFAYVGDANGQPVGGVDTLIQRVDPDNLYLSGASERHPSSADGWVTGVTNLAAEAPGGAWRIRVIVDVDYVGAIGNYGDGAVNPTEPGGKDQAVEFLSPYTADRILYSAAGFKPSTAAEETGNHAQCGQAFIIGCTLAVDDAMIYPDGWSDTVQGTPVEGSLARFNVFTGQMLHYDAATNTWISGDALRFFSLTQNPPTTNRKVFTRTFDAATTATWPVGLILVTCRVTFQGAPFQSPHVPLIVDSKKAKAHHITRDHAFEQAIVHAEALD